MSGNIDRKMEIRSETLNKSESGKTLNVTVPTSSTEGENYKKFHLTIREEAKSLDFNVQLNSVIDKGDGFRFSKSVNTGFSEQDADFYLNINDDVVLKPGSIRNALEYFNQDSELGLLGILLQYPDGQIQSAGMRVVPSWTPMYFYRRFTQYRSLFDGFREKQKFKELGIDKFLMFQNSRTRDGVKKGLITGTYHLISKDALKKTRGYDENYRMGIEDMDYCLTAIKEGFRIRVTHSVSAVHHEGGHGFDYHKAWGDETAKYFYSKWDPEKALSFVENNGELILS